MNKKRNNLIIAIITFLLVGNVYAESTLKDDTNYVTKTYKNIHLAMSDIKDTNLKPTEIINYMGDYLQNGTYYDSSNHDQTYYGLLGDGYAVCAGHNDAARVLTTLAGANCVNVTSASAKHMITSCYYDNDWYYFDATGSATDTNLQLPDKRFDVRAHTDIQYTNIHATFGPIDPKNRWNTWFFGTSEENIAFSALSRISPVPYGQDISYTTNHTFFDKTNRYYLESKNEERELYRENRTTGSKTKLASTLKNYIIGKTDVSYATGLVKDYDYLYYINKNDRKVYKIKTDGTGNTKVSDKETLNIWRTNGTIYGFNRTDDVFEIGKLSSYPKTGTLNINDGTSSYQIIYAYNNNGATILGVDGINGNTPKGVIQIPENLSGVPVIGIAPRAFYNFDNSIPTESLTLPANLIYIGSDAFNNTNIKKVTFNNKLISIGESAFYNANIEGKITIPDSVTYIGNRAFSNNNIEEEELGNGITVLYENTFSNNKLTKANIPDSLEVYSTTGRGGAFNSNNIENYIFGSKLKYLQLNSSNATTLENLKNVVIESPDLININVNYLDLEKVKFYIHAGTTTATTLTNANIPWINLDALTFNVIPEESEITIDMMKKQKQLKYTVEPSFLEYTEKSWTSSNTSVATVSSKGLVTLKKTGKTTITLTLSTGQTTTFKITVTDNPIKQISFDLPAKLPDGGKYVMQASITPSDADASDLVWTSSNESILKINSYDGKNVNFNTIGGGDVTITITAPNGVKSETQTFVYYPVKSFSLIRPTTMFIGEEYELSYKVTSDGEYYDSFRLTTENPELQINGKKISSNIAGQYTIKVLDHNNKSWGKYNVVFKEKKPITDLIITAPTTNLMPGEKTTLSAEIIPSDTTDSKTISWKSNKLSVASVNGNGVVYANNPGTATITATAGNISKSIDITVKGEEIAVTSVSLNKTSTTIEVGGSETLTATINPTTATNKTLTWKSSDTSVATVVNGKVTGVKAGVATITVTTNNGKSATCKVTIIKKELKISYTTHVQTYGWQDYVSNGAMSGTQGEAKRLEAIKIKLVNQPYTGNILYRTHIQTYGWEKNFKKNDEMSGTSGEAKRLEAIEIKLDGEMAKHYDVYYRVHAQTFGWLGWAKNGEQSGTAGYAKRLEGIEIKLIEKGKAFSEYGKSEPFKEKKVEYTTHVQNIGWQEYTYDGNMAGTSGQALRLEAIMIRLSNQKYSGNILYRTHIQSYGWEKEFKKNGEMSGTSGEAKRLEAIEIKLDGEMAKHYDVYYRVHAQTFGWLGWAKNGEQSGTAGYAKRLEGIEIVLVNKGEQPPVRDNQNNILAFVEK